MTSDDSSRDLTIFVPDRGRPTKIIEYVDNFRATIQGNTELVIILDEDDPDLQLYKNNLDYASQGYMVAPPTPRGMVGALNWGFLHYYGSTKNVGFQGSDHFPRTLGWDVAYVNELAAFPDGIGMVYGDDLFQSETMPTQIAMSYEIPRALGWMCPPEFWHLCVDVVWKDQGEALGRIKYLPGVVVEHMHPLAGKVKNDKQYMIVNNSIIARHDSAQYQLYKERSLVSDMERVRRVCGI
jgi:hypothetical protein